MNRVVQPETQKWLTNVVAVQYTANNINFEVACYANKVRSYKSGVESDINEVLQTDTIFSDMVQGQIINNKQLLETFQTTDKKTICEIILQKGRVQLTEQERSTEQNRAIKEIVAIVTQRAFNPLTKHPYPPQIVEDAIRNQLHYSPNNFPVSEQAAMVIKQLQQLVPIQMRPVGVYLEILKNDDGIDIKQLLSDGNVQTFNFEQEGCLASFETMSESVATAKKLLQDKGIHFLLSIQKTFRAGQ